jgi:flagellar protein FliO/FliZ
MTQSLLSVGVFLFLLACLPWALKWVKQRYANTPSQENGQLKFVSALAVGPHQRVVTVEVGPEGQRVWLTLGVTNQDISCLHRVDVGRGEAKPGVIVDANADNREIF